MKKIINGKKYDTDTAVALGEDSYGCPGDLNHWAEELYQKRTGEFFLYGRGGANSRYSEAVGNNSWSGGSRIMPMSYKEAQTWAEEHLSGDAYERIFGAVEEDDSIVSYSLRLSASTLELLRRRAAETGKTISAIADEILSKI